MPIDRSREFVAALTALGVRAYRGDRWDTAADHTDPTFWAFHPDGHGGVGVYVTYNQGTYDAGSVRAEHVEPVLKALAALPPQPSRQDIWTVLELQG